MQELKEHGCGCIHRAVDIPDEQELSARNFVAELTDSERDDLRDDSKVLDVVLEEGVARLRPKPEGEQSIYPILSEAANQSHDNWALDHCTTRNGDRYLYSHEGQNVDIVFVDSGVDPGHEEFISVEGSRVRQIEWKANQFVDRPKQYTDTHGHGTGVASCGVGVALGFAKGSTIYSIKIFDEDAYTPMEALQLVRTWHNAKTNGRPTIVNNSWGYSQEYPTGHPKAGLLHPIQVPSIDAEIESMIDAGMIVVSAAGNENHHVAAEGTPEYNEYYLVDANGNYVENEADAAFYENINRYSPGASGETICVGSIGEFGPVSKFRRSWFSNFGSRVDVFVPGRAIQCAQSLTTSGRKKNNGTSFSSGVLSGMLALWLELNPTANQADARTWMARHADPNEVVGSLEGATNLSARSLYNGIRFKYKVPHTVLIKRGESWVPMQNIITRLGAAYGNRRLS